MHLDHLSAHGNVTLLRDIVSKMSCLLDGSREIDNFNANFVTAWRDTHNYKIWLSGVNPGILDVHPGHPFAGQLSVADMKLRLSQ